MGLAQFESLFIEDASLDLVVQLLLFNARALVLLLSCFLVVHFVRNSAASRHFLIALAILSTLILPLSSRLLPTLDIEVSVTQTTLPDIIQPPFLQEQTGLLSDSGEPAPSTSWVSLQEMYISLLSLYALVAMGLIARLIVANLRMWLGVKLCQPVEQRYWQEALRRYRQDMGIGRSIRIRHSRWIQSPSTWGAIQPVILLPTSALHWPDHLIQSTLLHELAHIKRQDWLVQQLTRCICALYWVNPMAWRAHKLLCSSAEVACDDMALHHGVKKTRYADDLVNVATQVLKQHHTGAAVGMAASDQCSELSVRVRAILNPEGQHTPMTKASAGLILLLTLCLFMPLASLRANLIERVDYVMDYDLDALSIDPFASSEPVLPTPTLAPPVEAEPEHTVNVSPVVTEQEQTVFDLDEAKKLIDAERLALEASAKEKLVSLAKLELQENLPISAPVFEQALAIESRAPDISTDSPRVKITNPANRINIAAIEAPSPKNFVLPKYPRKAQNRGIEGKVIVEYSLDSHGNVVDARVVSASPKKVFDRQVLKAIKQSTFNPRKVGGLAVMASGLQEKYIFVLES